MDHQQITDVVLKHLRLNVDGLDDVEIAPARSMVEFGASSLDIVEVVSSSMRELRIRVPMTELSGVKNIGELVDVFVKHKDGGR